MPRCRENRRARLRRRRKHEDRLAIPPMERTIRKMFRQAARWYKHYAFEVGVRP